MPQPPLKTSGYDLLTDTKGLGLTQESIDARRLEIDQAEARKAREDRLKKYLNEYDDDPITQTMARAQFRIKEQEDYAAEQKRIEKAIADKHDDPLMKTWAIGQHRMEQTQSLQQKQAFEDRERLEQLRTQDKESRTLDRMGMGFAPLRETVGAAVNTVPDLASVVARLSGDKTAADTLNRQSNQFQGVREQSREDDMSPWASRMYGGASQSMIQMAATPGGAGAKIAGAGVMSGNQALTTAEDAGLTGGARLRYAGSQALFEAGVAALGQKIFGPGIESRAAGQAIAAQTWRQLARNIGTDALKEMPEEVVTSILQNISSKYEGVTPDMSLGDFIADATEAAVQAAMMAPMASTVGGDVGRVTLNELRNLGKSSKQTTPVFEADEETPTAAPEEIQGHSIDEMIAARDAAEQEQPAQLAKRPAIKAFLNSPKPSRKLYETAVKAGLPDIGKTTQELRKKYAEDFAAQAAPPATEEPTGKLPPTKPAEVLDTDSELPDVIELMKGAQNEAEATQGNEIDQGTKTPQGVLTDGPTQEADTPKWKSKEDFAKHYQQVFDTWMQYPLDQAGNQHYAEILSGMHDAHPDWADEVEQTIRTQTPPVATGGPAPVQSSPLVTEPGSLFPDPLTPETATPEPSTLPNRDLEEPNNDKPKPPTNTWTPKPEGVVRVVHISYKGLAKGIRDKGLNYAKQGMLQSTARLVDNEADLTTDDPKYQAGIASVFDIPVSEYRQHDDVVKSPGVVPAKYLVSQIPIKGGKPVTAATAKTETTPAPQKPIDKSVGRSLRSIVLSQGGINTKSLKKDYNFPELRSDGLLGISRLSGRPLDEMAQILESSGDLRTPPGRTPADWLIEQLKANADGARAEYSDAEIEARLEAERNEHERLKEYEQYGVNADGIEKLRKRSEEEGIRAANEGEPDEGFDANNSNEAIDTSFNFGANVKSDAGEEDTFTLKRPEKPKPKPEDFGTNPNTKQGGLFDAGKKGDKKGQELLFNSDPGDLNNPKTMENKAKADDADAKWWNNTLTTAGRSDIIKTAGLKLNPKALWRHLDEDDRAKLRHMRPPEEVKFEYGDTIERIDDPSIIGRFEGTNSSGGLIVKYDGTRTTWNAGSAKASSVKLDDQGRRVKPTESDIKAGVRAEILRQIAEEAAAVEAAAKKPATPKPVKTGQKPKTPRKPRTKTGEKLGKLSEETGAEAKAEFDKWLKAVKGMPLNSALGAFNPELAKMTVTMVRAQVKDKVVKFADLVERIANWSSPEMARNLSDYIEAAWDVLRETDSRLDPTGKVADVLDAETEVTKRPTPKTGWEAVPSHFAEQLASGKSYKSINEARSEAGDIIGTPIKPGTPAAKRLDEAIEYGIVQAGRKIVEDGGDARQIFDKLVDMYARQPVLGVRNSTSMEMQAYSTPVPLAFLTSQLGNVTPDTTVYEPTAGNGMLLIGTDIKNALANELDPDRARILRDQGFKVTENDAATTPSPKVQTVLANPPFGKVKDDNRKTITFDVDGFRTTEIDHAIALQSLKGMEADGHTVLILAAKGHDAKTDMERRKAYSIGKDRPFYDSLYNGYDVTQHFTVDGSLYSRQGASFPVDVIVLRPQGTVPVEQKRSTPWAMPPRIFNNWQEIGNAFLKDAVADTGGRTGILSGEGDNGSPDLSTRNTDDMGRVPGSDENTSSMAEGDVNATEPQSTVSTPVDGKVRGGRRGAKSGGSRTQSGLSGSPQTKRGGTGDVSATGEARSGSKGLDSGTRPDGMAGTSATEPGEVDSESHQSSYEPASKNKTVDTLIPTNLQDAARLALETVEETYGPVDEFVRSELGYSANDPFFNDMSAEQVDAIALAIHSHKSGGGMIVGDMTGVGKGRVAAAMMRYADRQNLVPVFVTEKPDLFGDIYRDLADIGSDTPENPFFAQPTNNTAGANAIDLPNGRKLQTSKETNLARLDEALASLKSGNGFRVNIDGVPTKINAVFTMYSQLQTVKGEETQRRQQLRELMPHAYLIMDESHNAGGTTKERVNEDAPPDRAAYAREIVQTAGGVMYLSATFAKRPDVMDLYSRTDMAKAVDGDITKLGEIIKSGGLPLQQVVSAMLGEVGQYIRREKSFEGIEFSKVDVGVDLEEQDRITDIYRTIRSLDAVVAKVVDDMNEELVAAGEHGVAGDIATGDQGMVSTSFGSILWNAVDQMLFALKADKAADEAIASWKNGEVPVLAVDNTMESILDEYVVENNLKVGDQVNLSFKDILHRYLERSRWMTVDTGMRDSRNKKITRKVRLTDEQLNVETELGNALALFTQAAEAIANTNVNAPASPIDWIRYRMEKAGMKIGEITGRKSMLIYTDHNTATLGARPKAERGTRGKQNTIRRINDGSLDGLLLNRSGATGVSIHASEKFKNKKVRHMIIVQAAKNIDEFMQMLGRVNRTGQVTKPRYSLAMSDSPSELRPAAVLAKKLASLNASVTAKSKGAVGFTVTDVMNQVGGGIVAQYLVDNPEFADALDMSMDELREDAEADSLEDIVRKATGRSAILSIAQQREFWEDITAGYNAKIEELNALNANPLIAQTMDLNAKTLQTISLFEGKPNEGPFAAPADMVRMDVRNPGKPMTPDQVRNKITEFYSIPDVEARHGAAIKWGRETIASMTQELVPFRQFAISRLINPDAITARNDVLDTQLETVSNAIENFPPGTVVDYVAEGFPFQGVVVGFSRSGKTGNPVAPSRWFIEVAINDAAKKLNVPVSQSRNLFVRTESLDRLLGSFEYAQTTSREKRWMGTGNLLAAYAQLSSQNGKLIFYTDDQGATKRGILMPRSFDAAGFMESKAVQFGNAQDILSFFNSGGTRLVTADGNLVIVKRDNQIILSAPRARSRGGKYTLNRGITDAAGQDFVSVGNQMVLRSSDQGRQRAMLDAVLALSPIEARLESDREIARAVLGVTKTGERNDADSDEVAEPETPDYATAEPETPPANTATQDAIRAQEAKNAEYLKIMQKEWQKVTQGLRPATFVPVTDEMLRAASKYMLGTIRVNVLKFSDFMTRLRRDMDEAAILAMKPNLIRTWNALKNKYSLDDATEAAFEIAMSPDDDPDVETATAAMLDSNDETPATPQDPAPTPAASQDPVATAEDEGTYSTKNAYSARVREELGMGERQPVPTQGREASVKLAAEIGKTEAGRFMIDKLIAELQYRPRAVTPQENDLLLYRQVELKQKLREALQGQVEAARNGNDVQEAIQTQMASDFRQQRAQLIELVHEPTGTAAARALQARKAIVNDDFTLEHMALEYEAAFKEAPSTAQLAEMEAKIKALEADVAALEKLVAEEEAKNNDLETRLKEAHDNKVKASESDPVSPEPATEDAQPKAPATPATRTRREKALDRINRGAERIKDLLEQNTAFSVSGVLDEVATAAVEMATGYSELGVITFGEFIKRVGRKIGKEAVERIRPQLVTAWKQVRSASAGQQDISSITNKIDPMDPDTIGRAARALHSFVIERDGLDASAEGREAAVKAVHEILIDFVPDLTEEETARAMSGIGIYTELSKDAIEAIRRDQKAQLLSLEHIADWKKAAIDEANEPGSGKAPPATGRQHPPVSDEQRLLRRLVAEAKKLAGISSDKEGLLRSALDAAKRMATNRIADLTKAIESGKRLARSQKLLQPDAELEALQAERDALQKLYDQAFGRPQLSEEQRINMAEKALDRAISKLEADLKEGKLYPADPRPRPTSAAIEAKRAELDALKASRDELRLSSGEAQQRSDAAYERHLKARDAELARRLAAKEYAPKPKKPERVLTPAMEDLAFSIAQKQLEMKKQYKEWQFKNRHIVYRTWMKGPVAAAHMIRKGLTTFDQSLIGRQGGLLGVINPKIYARAISKAFSNPLKTGTMFTTEKELFALQAALDADTHWVRLEKIGKLSVTDVHGGLNREEDARFVPEWFDKIPGIGGSERSGSAFINTQRRLVYRSLVDKLATKLDGKRSITNAELRVIGNFVNVSTGRGTIGSHTAALDTITTVFFSPRWWASRINWMSGQPIWHDARWAKGEGASKEVRQMIAVEWGKQAAAQAVIMGLAVAGMTAAFGPPGDDEEWDWYYDPRSPNFGKLRISRSYIDLTFGVGQHVSMLFRLLIGQQIDRWGGNKEIRRDAVFSRYMRGKLAPVAAVVGDHFVGKDMENNEFGSPEWWVGHVTPLMIQDVDESRTEGPVLATALSLMMFFGLGSQTYEERTREREDVTNELRTLKNQNAPPEKIQQVLREHLKHAATVEAKNKFRTATTEEKAHLQKVIDKVESSELDDAIRKEQYDLILNASARVSTDKRRVTNNEAKVFSGNDDKSRLTSRSLIPFMIPNVDDAIDLYNEAYRAENGSIREKNGNIKPAVYAGRARIRALYK